MTTPSVERKIRYQEDIDPTFSSYLTSTPGGEQLQHCIQCGTCSATCPLSIYMDYTPRRIIAMACAGLKDDVLKSLTIWLCSSCYSCTVECPKKIKITDIMYSLKRLAIEEGRYPRRFPIPVLAKEFYNVVQRKGRSNEMGILIRLALKTNPFRYLKKLPLGLKLFGRGRLSFKGEKIRGKRELAAVLQHLSH